jgi:hypothetical protein
MTKTQYRQIVMAEYRKTRVNWPTIPVGHARTLAVACADAALRRERWTLTGKAPRRVATLRRDMKVR